MSIAANIETSLNEAFGEGGLLGFAIKGGALSRLATPKVGYNTPVGPTPPGTGGAGGGDSDNGTGGAGGNYNTDAQAGSATANGATGGGGGGDGAFTGNSSFAGNGFEGGSIGYGAAGASFNGGTGGAAGAQHNGANGSNGAGGQTAGSGTDGGGGGGGGGSGNLAFEQSSLPISTNTTGFNGGAGGAGAGTNAGGGGGGEGGYGALTDQASAVTLGAVSIQGGAGGAGGAGVGTGLGGVGGAGGFGIGFNAGATSSLSIASGGSVTGGAGGAGGAGGNATNGGIGGIGLYELDSTSFTLTNDGAVTGGHGGAPNIINSTSTGGVGVTGANLTIVNGGTISGGGGTAFGPFGPVTTTADAIDFTSGANVLTLSHNGVVGTTHGAIGDAGSLQINAGVPGSATLSSDIHGAGSMEKIGAGTVILTGADTAAGGTTVTAGVLQVGNGSSAVTIGIFPFSTTTNPGSISGNVTDNATLVFDRGDAQTFSGVISGTGVVHTLGAGVYTLSGANTYSGGTTISAGELGITNSTYTGTAPAGTETSSSVGTGAVTFDGGKLQAGAAGLEFENAAVLNSTGGGFDVNGRTLTWDGVISNGSGAAANLTVTDTSTGAKGTLVLDAANTYSGGAHITGGATLSVGHVDTNSNVDALGAGTITIDGGSTLLNGYGDFIDFQNNIAIGVGGGVISDDTNQDGVELDGAISGTGHLTLTNGNFYTFGAAGSFSGTTLITGDSILLAGNNSLAHASDVQVDLGSTLRLNGLSANTIGSLADGPNGGGQVYDGSQGGHAATLTLGDATSTTFSGQIEDSNVAGGVLTLIKQGSGTFTEAGANLYSGGTTLNAGTLELSHATTGTFGAISSGAAGSGAITFGGGAAKLQIDSVALGSDAAHTFAYAINGFTAGETLEVKDGAGSVDTTTYDAGAGTLTLVNGVNMEAVLHIGTGYSGDTFSAAYDGNNGTDIMVTVPAPPPPPSGGGGGGGSTGGGDIPSQQGGSGDDTLTAGSGMDTVYGGAGDDHLNGGTGHAMLYGNTGNDTVTLFSYTQESTVYGGQGDDTIDASQSTHANFISADLGNDSIIGGAGNDTLYGGGGADTVVAGSGQDQLYGNTGDDYIYIGAGNGGATVFGGQGNDVIDASSAPHAVFISGDLGTDIILGSKGSDTIHGGEGSDTIIAASGSTEHIHVGTADSSALAGAGVTELDHVTGFGSGDVLVFDGDPAGTDANTLSHGGDASIANFAAAYAYAYGDGTHAAAIAGAIEYAVVSDTSGHVYVFAADHAAVELDGLTNGVAGVTAAQLLAA